MIVIPYNQRGIDLHTFLESDECKKIYNKRILYVVKPNRGKVFKFGIGGYSSVSNTDAKDRLYSYIKMYGVIDPDDHCSGVKIHYLEASDKNPRVQKKNSAFAKKEKKLMNQLKTYNLPHRGSERVEAPFRELTKVIGSYGFKQIKDNETKRRRR